MDGYGRGGRGRGRGGAGGGRGRGDGGGGGGDGRGRGRGGGDGRGGGYQHRPQQHQQQFQHQNDLYRDYQAPQQLRGLSSSSSQTKTYAPPSEGCSGRKQVGSARQAPSEAWKTGAWGTGALEGGGERGSVRSRGQQVSVQSSPTPSSEPDHDFWKY